MNTPMKADLLKPSAVPFREDMAAFFETPRKAPSEIQDVIERFGRSAAICKKAGFSGVEIHGAHGYLVSQFLSPSEEESIETIRALADAGIDLIEVSGGTYEAPP